MEKRKEKERKAYVRPWDKNKVPSKSRRSSSSSSESDDDEEEKEWKPQRERRVMTQDEWNEKQRQERKKEFAPISSSFLKSDTLYDPSTDYEETDKSLFFTTAKKFKRRNQSPEAGAEATQHATQKGAAIPPPATFEYFGPSSSKQSKPAFVPPADLSASISAGLKFLREQVDKGNKNKFTASSDYNAN